LFHLKTLSKKGCVLNRLENNVLHGWKHTSLFVPLYFFTIVGWTPEQCDQNVFVKMTKMFRKSANTRVLFIFFVLEFSNCKLTEDGTNSCIVSRSTNTATLYTYIWMYLRTYVRAYVHMCVPTYICAYLPTYVRTYVHTYVRTHVHTYVCNNVYTSTSVVRWVICIKGNRSYVAIKLAGPTHHV
jgi:hypothetical protein